MEPDIFLRCEGKIFLLTNAKARAKHSFFALKNLKPISLRHREVRKAPGIAICTKKVRISDQAMKTTSFTQAAIFVYFTGAHVSGIWVLEK